GKAGSRSLERSARGPKCFYWPAGPKTRSAEPAMFHGLPERSVMPMASVITAGNWTPGADPAATSSGLAVIDRVSVSPSKLSAHDMFVPQTMSATVCERPPVQPGGPLLCEAGAPQSPSVTRMRAAGEDQRLHGDPARGRGRHGAELCRALDVVVHEPVRRGSREAEPDVVVRGPGIEVAHRDEQVGRRLDRGQGRGHGRLLEVPLGVDLLLRGGNDEVPVERVRLGQSVARHLDRVGERAEVARGDEELR